MVVQDWVGVYAFRREVDRRNLAILLPGALFGVILAFVLAARVSEDVVRLAIGVVSIGFVVVTLVRDRWLAAKPTRAEVAPGLFWGALSGFASFVSHAGGPPFLVYTMPQRLPAPVFAGTSVLFFALVNLMKVPPYIVLGLFSRANLLTSLTLLPLAIASTLAGVWVVRRVPAEKFYGACSSSLSPSAPSSSSTPPARSGAEAPRSAGIDRTRASRWARCVLWLRPSAFDLLGMWSEAGMMEQPFLRGAGAMAAAFAQCDWEASPVGPPASWSPALKATLGLILPAKAEIVLFWGAEYVALYNEAYAPTIGSETSARARATRARELVRAVGRPGAAAADACARPARPFSAKDRPFYIERHGVGETVYFDISYSAVREADGAIGGVLCIVAETTMRVLAQNRLASERERLAQLFQQTPSFMALLEGPDACVHAGQSRLPPIGRRAPAARPHGRGGAAGGRRAGFRRSAQPRLCTGETLPRPRRRRAVCEHGPGRRRTTGISISSSSRSRAATGG